MVVEVTYPLKHDAQPGKPELAQEHIITLAEYQMTNKEKTKGVQDFADRLNYVAGLPSTEKPPRDSWKVNEEDRTKIEILELYALKLDAPEIEHKFMAEWILQTMGFADYSRSSTATKVLISIGYSGLHEILEIVLNSTYNDKDEVISAEVDRLFELPDKHEKRRTDLTGLDAYAIDRELSKELDDALSATRLPDGRIKVWIHIADPTSYVELGSLMEIEARKRGTSVYLPTGNYLMFPERLAMGRMSLKQGNRCRAVSAEVTLNNDGSMAESFVYLSTIKPTHMLSYKDATELLNSNDIEEGIVLDLQLLSDAAKAHYKLRTGRRAIKIQAHLLVDEMMLLCGEAVASFGSGKNISLPYEGQGDSRRVKFTAPIRRYTDLLSHYQVKAFIITGEELRLSGLDLDRIRSDTKSRMKDSSYWKKKIKQLEVECMFM